MRRGGGQAAPRALEPQQVHTAALPVPPPTHGFSVNQYVEVFLTSGQFVAAKVDAVHTNGTFLLRLHDGRPLDYVPESSLRPITWALN